MQRKVVADVADQSSTKSKIAKHMVKHALYVKSWTISPQCAIWKLSQRDKGRHRHVWQVLEEKDSSKEESTDSDGPIFKVEEVSNMKTPGKQINADLVFLDFAERECQLDMGATCNVMSLHDIAVIN